MQDIRNRTDIVRRHCKSFARWIRLRGKNTRRLSLSVIVALLPNSGKELRNGAPLASQRRHSQSINDLSGLDTYQLLHLEGLKTNFHRR